MAKKYMKAGHTQIDYASLDNQGSKGLIASQGEALASEAANIEINSKAKDMSLPFLPSVHTMLTNAYSVIDLWLGEIRHHSVREVCFEFGSTGQPRA